MRPNHLIPTLAALCATAYADPIPDPVIVTDPSKIINSTTYDLGERLMTVQELTKEALPMPPPQPVIEHLTLTPRPAFRNQNRGFISLGARIYRRTNQPTRSLISYQILGQKEPITFWSSADWSMISGIENITAPDGKIWQLMCMPIIYEVDRPTNRQRLQALPVIPDMPAGKTSYQLISGNPTAEQMTPIDLYHAYYDSHHAELRAAQQARLIEQQRLAAENLANPPEKEDITVQYRILDPEEIVTPENTAKTP